MKLPSLSSKTMRMVLRITIGFIFITHGIARLYYGSVTDFGGFLNSHGLMLGIILAWVITVGEILFGSFMVVGYKVRYAVIFHILVVLSGVVMIHFKHGWFVVGHGSNGVEYSVLLLAVLAYLYSSEK